MRQVPRDYVVGENAFRTHRSKSDRTKIVVSLGTILFAALCITQTFGAACVRRPNIWDSRQCDLRDGLIVKPMSG